MPNILCLVLGGGRGTRLYPLTKFRAKPAVPLGGKYRLIDIPLSNCINSGLNRIYVLTQFNSVSLHRHIRRTYVFDAFGGSRNLGVSLTAFASDNVAGFYSGIRDYAFSTASPTYVWDFRESDVLVNRNQRSIGAKVEWQAAPHTRSITRDAPPHADARHAVEVHEVEAGQVAELRAQPCRGHRLPRPSTPEPHQPALGETQHRRDRRGVEHGHVADLLEPEAQRPVPQHEHVRLDVGVLAQPGDEVQEVHGRAGDRALVADEQDAPHRAASRPAASSRRTW